MAKTKSEKKPTVIGGYTMPPKEEKAIKPMFTVEPNAVEGQPDQFLVKGSRQFKNRKMAEQLCFMLNAAYQLFKEGDRASGLDAPVTNVKKAKKEKVA